MLIFPGNHLSVNGVKIPIAAFQVPVLLSYFWDVLPKIILLIVTVNFGISHPLSSCDCYKKIPLADFALSMITVSSVIFSDFCDNS